MQNLKYLIICLILDCELSFAQIINFPDQNFKNKLLQASTSNTIAYSFTSQGFIKIDTNNDSQIDVNEALQVSGLNLSNSNISSLVGIDSFTNLTSFSFNDNNISSANLSSLTLLTTIFCQNNILNQINLSYLSNLKVLYCKNNFLQHIDVSQNPQLQSLVCSNNSNLQTINFNNGTVQSFPPTQGPTENWTGLPNLSAICADNGEISSLQN